MLSTTPPSGMRGSTSCVSASGASALASITRANALTSRSASDGSGLGPSRLALLTSRSIRGPAASTSARRCAASATSPAIAVALGPSDPAASRSASAPRASMTRLQPSRVSARASASPRPREAPVMIPVGMAARSHRAGLSFYGQLDLGLPADPRAHGIHRGLRAVGHAELAEHVRDVGLDRLLAQPELEGDALVGQPARDEREDLLLARRQPRPLRGRLG